jgi:adenine-specific DNA-methyltransferase
VQLPEIIDPDSKDQKASRAFCERIGRPATIAEITKERVRRAIKKLEEENKKRLDLDKLPDQDRGFRLFKLAESNFQVWEAGASNDADSLGEQLELHVDHVRPGRDNHDLLHEILLKSGFPLTTSTEELTLAGKTVFTVGSGVFLICLDRELTLEVIRAMAAMKPSRIVCLDDGFRGNDQLKVNAVQAFKTNGIAKFQTV